MPNDIIPNQYKRAMANRNRDEWNSGNWRIHLGTNDINPDDFPDFTPSDAVEADFDGYAPIVSDNWSNATTDVDGNAIIMDDVRQFTKTSGPTTNQVYIYWLENQLTNAVAFASRFPDAPIPFVNTDDSYALRLQFGDNQIT